MRCVHRFQSGLLAFSLTVSRFYAELFESSKHLTFSQLVGRLDWLSTVFVDHILPRVHPDTLEAYQTQPGTMDSFLTAD